MKCLVGILGCRRVSISLCPFSNCKSLALFVLVCYLLLLLFMIWLCIFGLWCPLVYVNIGSYRAIVKYEGKRSTCRLCDDESHFSNTCPEIRRNREAVVEKTVVSLSKKDETIKKKTTNEHPRESYRKPNYFSRGCYERYAIWRK
jgi:hypothetical protein